MSAFTEAIEKAEKKEFTQDEVIDWLESVYNFCIPENKEAGEHAFNVLDYLYMEDLGAHINRQYSEIDTLRAQLAEAREANERLAWRMKWIIANPGDGIALRYAFKATDEEVDDIRSKEQVNTA